MTKEEQKLNSLPKALLIAGVHRSGTSALTRILNLLGAHLSSNLMPADEEENPTGFWESKDISNLNDEVLLAARSSWDDVLPVDFESIEQVHFRNLQNRAFYLLDRDFCNVPFFAIKDPRFSRLLPFWLPIIQERGFQPHVLIPFRNPLEVAASLHRRNGFPQDKGIYIWLRNMLDCLRHSSNCTHALISYDSLMDNWNQAVRQLGDDLEVVWPVELSSISHEVDDFLDHKLRHFESRNTTSDNGSLIDQLASQLYAAGCKRDENLDSIVDAIHQTLAPMEEVMAPLLRAQTLAITAEREKWWTLTNKLRNKLENTLLCNGLDQNKNVSTVQNLLDDTTVIKTRQLQFYLFHEFGDAEKTRILNAMQLLRMPNIPKFHKARPNENELFDMAELVSGVLKNIPKAANPDVSIIIPVCNQLHFTLCCLYSVCSNKTRYSFELILADDSSTDGTAHVITEKLAAIRHIRTAENRGFLRNCNGAAAHAKGTYLVFLNNDTYTLPGWLDNLIGTLEQDPGVGLVGSKLVFPNGKLQESGGLVFSDGSAWNYGRGDDPCNPQYCYQRDTDYVSGASMALPRHLWVLLGGFDERYKYAYYEDTDLAFRIRETGLRVVVQPTSQVIHFEGISSNQGKTTSAKRYLQINADIFKDRWSHILPEYGRVNPEDLPIHRKMMGCILVIDKMTPTPDQDEGSVLNFNILRMLTSFGLQVIFASEELAHCGKYTHALQRIGIEVLYMPYEIHFNNILKKIGAKLDYILVYRAPVASGVYRHLRQLAPQARIIFNTVDLHYLRMRREADLISDSLKRRNAEVMKLIELDLIRKCEASIVVSLYEFNILQEIMPIKSLYHLPICRDIPLRSDLKFDNRNDIVFIGGFMHQPNIDAVLWFVAEVVPLLKANNFPGQFIIAGSNIPPKIYELAQPGVVVRGFIPDLEELMSRIRLTVAPLRYGAGLKGKVISSMSYGVPVVATSVAAEGAGFIAGEHLLVADHPELMAEAILSLYNNYELWERISENGYEFCRSHFSIQSVACKLRDILKDLRPEIALDEGLCKPETCKTHS